MTRRTLLHDMGRLTDGVLNGNSLNDLVAGVQDRKKEHSEGIHII